MMAAMKVLNATGPQAMAYGSGGYSFGFPEGVSVTDFVPDHIKHMIHPHWEKFPPVNPMWHYLLGVVYLFLGAISLFGNGMVLLLFMKNKNLRSPANYLVANLAIFDFIMMLKTPVFIVNSFNEGPVWGKLGCDVFALMGSYAGIGGAVTNAAIAYDRYKTIAKPFEAKMSRSTAFLMVVGIWAYASPWSLLPLFGIWGRFVPEGFLTTCSFDYLSEDLNTRSFVGAIFVFSYILPGMLIVYFYSQIFSHVKSHEKAMHEQAKKMNVTNLRSNAEANAQSAEVRIAKVAMTNVALWLVCWTPYAAVVVQGLFFNQEDITPIVSMLPALLAKSASVYNPIIYAINHTKFRLALTKQMPGFCIHEEEEKASGADSKSTDTQKA
uniref:Opsin protein n=1 Tax=Leptuca pugilator TaxID=6772 RepID=E5G6F2_LEPPG|nr:opsin protein [Leptuca pugilator]